MFRPPGNNSPVYMDWGNEGVLDEEWVPPPTLKPLYADDLDEEPFVFDHITCEPPNGESGGQNENTTDSSFTRELHCISP